MHGAGEAVGRQPLRHGVGLDKGAIDLVGFRRQNAVQSNGVGHGCSSGRARRQYNGSRRYGIRRQYNHEESDTIMTKSKSASKVAKAEDSPSRLIDARIKELDDWRGETLARVREVIKEADPDVVEEVKWKKPSNGMRGVPVWEDHGIICTGETYKAVVKLTFAKGASIKDPSGLFNSSLEGNVRRAIDIHEGDKLDEKALKALIRAAVALNTSQATVRPVRSQKSQKRA